MANSYIVPFWGGKSTTEWGRKIPLFFHFRCCFLLELRYTGNIGNGECDMTTFWFPMPQDEEFSGVVLYCELQINCDPKGPLPVNASYLMVL